MALSNVIVLRGGPSSEHEVSLMSGETMIRELPKNKYNPIDIVIDRSGNWTLENKPTTPERVLRHADVVLNAMHGEYGEDGGV